ncbi:MAG: DUF2141 domain-containing protein [Bacteroidota bacterium]
MKKIILVVTIVTTASDLAAQGKVTVTIEDVESDRGYVYFNVFQSDDGFPNEWNKVYKQQKLKAKEGEVSYTFNELPFGTYAISIAHDENGNGEVDTNFVGFPKEPVGASNQTGFGKPSFNRSRFELSPSNASILLKMNFLN